MIPSIFLQGLGTTSLKHGGTSGKGGDGGFSDILGRITDRVAGSTGSGNSKTVSLSGHSGLSSLKKALMAEGRSLDSYTVNGEALSEFGSMLAKMGFDTAEVDEMISTLKNRVTDGKVTLADLFKGASQLTEPDSGQTALLDVSAMSDLETILGKLGLDSETSQGLLSEALVDDGQAIDLAVLAAGIRRELAAGDGTGTPTDYDLEGILGIMERIGLVDDADASAQATLDDLISEVSRLNDLQDVLDDTDGADGLPGSLLISYLQQLTAPLGEAGQELRDLIASAGTDDGGFDGDALLSKLVQVKKETTATASKTPVPEGQTGRMSLDRFAAMLESRVAEGSPESRITLAQGAAGNTVKSMPATGAMAESVGGFLENVTVSAENTSREAVFPVDPESDATLKAEWQPDAKRFSKEDRFRKAAGSASETAGKQAASQSSSDAPRQTASSGGTDGRFSDSGTGKQTADRFSDALNGVGREKTHTVSNDSGLNADSLVRDLKAGSEAAATAKADTGRNLPSYLLNQVSRQIVQMRNAGENDITLQLKPPHLGRMKLNIEHTTGGGMRVGIVVESAAARDMLLAHSNELKASLADQGLRLDQIDVEAQADFGQSMAQADKGFEQSGGRGRWSGARGAEGGDTAEAVAGSAAASSAVEPGRVNLVA